MRQRSKMGVVSNTLLLVGLEYICRDTYIHAKQESSDAQQTVLL